MAGPLPTDIVDWLPHTISGTFPLSNTAWTLPPGAVVTQVTSTPVYLNPTTHREYVQVYYNYKDKHWVKTEVEPEPTHNEYGEICP